MAFWVVLTASFVPRDLAMGMAGIFGTVAFAVFIRRAAAVRAVARMSDRAQGSRIPWYVVSGFGEITLVLGEDNLRIAPAKTIDHACGFGSSIHDRIRAACRVPAVVHVTSAPNFVVVSIEPPQSRLRFHQVESIDVPQITRSLRAG